MKKIKGRKVIYEADGEIEYQLKNGLVASVMDLNDPFMKMMYKITGMDTKGKDYSVEIIRKGKNTRAIVELADLMTFEEMVKYLDEQEKRNETNR